jgi:hypothetical protein
MALPRLRQIALSLLILLGAACAPAVAAAAPPRLSVTVQQPDGQPTSYFTVSSQAGRRAVAGTVLVRNEDRHPITVDIDPVNAETAANLGSAYSLGDKPLRDAARWLRTAPRHASLAPGESEEVRVAVAIPAGEDDGEYLAGVAIQARNQDSKPTRGAGVAIASAQRYVVGVQVNAGEARRPLLAFAGAKVERQPAGVTFLVKMRNRGNVILQDVTGRVEVERDGHRIAAERIGPGTFVTGTAIEFPVLAAREDPAEGTDYRVRAVARYEGRQATLDEVVSFGHVAAERQQRFGGRAVGAGFPWWWPAIAAAAILLLAAVVLYRRRRAAVPLLSEEGTVALIERELAAPGAGPITAVAIGPLPQDPELRETLVLALSGRLRVTDRLTEPRPGTIVIVAPNTSETAAAALLEDAQRLVGYVGGGTAVAARTTTPPAQGREVLYSVLAGLAPHSPTSSPYTTLSR